MNQQTHSVTKNSAVRLPRLSEKAIFVPIGALMILTLQFQTLPLDIPIQTLPFTTVIALFAFPFVAWKMPKSPLLIVIGLFGGFTLIHSVVALYIDVIGGYPDTRFIAWLRQFVAMSAGIVTFIVFRQSLLYFPLEKIFRLLLIGAVPALLVAVLNIMWGALNMQWAGTVVKAVRDLISPTAYTSAFRATGFSTEPSTLATLIVLLIVPVLLIYFGQQRKNFTLFVMLGLTVIVFVWTFSISGLILLLVFLFAGMIIGPMRGGMFLIVLLFFSFVGVTVLLFPSNQILRHARMAAVGQTNVSMTDRFFGSVGPFLRSVDSFTALGYGLGGVSAHFDEVLPTEVQAEILSAKWKEYPTLSSLFGRTFAETGAVGLALFLAMIWLSFWQLSRVLDSSRDENSRLEFAGIRLVLIVVYMSMFVTIGPYHTPYFWFWIAVVDAQYVSARLKSNGV